MYTYPIDSLVLNDMIRCIVTPLKFYARIIVPQAIKSEIAHVRMTVFLKDLAYYVIYLKAMKLQ